MKHLKVVINIFLIFNVLIYEGLFTAASFAAFDVRGVRLFRDGNICINQASGGTTTVTSLVLSTDIQSNSQSFLSKISSSGSYCSPPPFFTGGLGLTSANGTLTQAQPTVQSLGRGILISESAGNTSGISSSGDPEGFRNLIQNSLANSGTAGTVATTIFEISLPVGCDVIDDDDDIAGASSDLTTVNDFSLPTCSATNGLTVECNNESGLLSAMNGLVAAQGTQVAKVRFVLSSVSSVADLSLIDSILISFDSQDVFCPITSTDPLVATVIAKNAVDSPTKTVTLGIADLGTPAQAGKISFGTETATSQKGEISTNEIGPTPVLSSAMTTLANQIQIEELNNESIPIGGQSSPILLNPSLTSNVTNTTSTTTVNLWLVPSSNSLFSAPPGISDISFSDNSLIVSSAPYLVRTNTDDLNAPFGTIVILIKKNTLSGATDPQTIKTTITIKNITLGQLNSSSTSDTVLLSFFEPISGAIVNTPGTVTINKPLNPNNPRNFTPFSIGSIRALEQGTVINGAVNDTRTANQITTDTDLSFLTSRNTDIGTPQISPFTKVISTLTPIDTNKISISNSNSVFTIAGSASASVGGGKVKIESFAKGSMTAFDSVTITSKNDGAFTAKLQADFSGGDVTVKFTQIISQTESVVSLKTVEASGPGVSTNLACEKTVCGCENPNCTPTVILVASYIETNGGLASIVSKGGATLDELIKSAKKALGLS